MWHELDYSIANFENVVEALLVSLRGLPKKKASYDGSSSDKGYGNSSDVDMQDEGLAYNP
jgi:hypothetical protein